MVPEYELGNPFQSQGPWWGAGIAAPAPSRVQASQQTLTLGRDVISLSQARAEPTSTTQIPQHRGQGSQASMGQGPGGSRLLPETTLQDPLDRWS